MIEVKHLYKVYPGPLTVLKNIQFQLEAGEFVFLTGKSGAGKTTLFNILCCFDQCTSGEVKMADFKITEIKRNQIPLYRRQLGIVFQDFKLLKTKTVLENTMMPLLATGLNPQKAEQQSQATLKTLGLSERVHLFPQQLSGGEQQKVSLARALVHRPRIILADEPTGNLDPQSALEVKKILEGLCHSGTTVLVITHDERWVQESNYRNLKLENGEILNP